MDEQALCNCITKDRPRHIMTVLKRIGLFLLPAYIIAISILVYLQISTIFESSQLLLIFNTVFIGLIPIAIAYRAARVHIISGTRSFMLTGPVMLTFGLSSILAASLISLLDGPNILVTIHDSSVLLGSILQTLGGLLFIAGATSWTVREKANRSIIGVYGGIVVCLVTISLFSGCFTVRSAFGEYSKPVIRVGSEVEFPPFALVDQDGKPAGFSVDLIKAIAHAAGLTIVFETGEWDKMWNGLASGKLDVLPIVAKSPERNRLVDFGLPHTETFDAFFVRDGSPTIGSIEAAQGKKIVVMRSDAAHHELQERNFQGELVLVDTIPEGLSMVASGKCDAFLCSKLIGSLTIKEHGIRGLTAGPFIPDYKRVFSIGVKKGADDLREKLNQGLLIVKVSGLYDKIYEKWLSVDDPWVKYRKYMVPAFLIAAAIALLTMLGLAILRRLVKKRTAELNTKNQELEQQIVARERVEEELVRHKQGLETLIQERTRALKESEARLRSYFEFPLVGIAITSLDKGWLEVNPALCDMLGYSQQELSGVTWTELTHPDDLAADVTQFQRVLVGEIDTYAMEKRFIPKNGDVLWTTLSVSCVRKPDGSVDYMVALLQDITMRKRAEETVWRLASIVESSDDAIIGTTLDGTITIWNKGAEKLYGYSAEEIIGQPISDLLPPEVSNDLPDILTSISRGDVVKHFETKRRTKDGRIVDVSLTISPIKRQEGQIIGASSTARDITERKLLEQENQKLIDELKMALSEVKKLSGFLPICSSCKKIRDDKGYWKEVERYIGEHSEAQFSHGICPACMRKLYPEYADEVLLQLEKNEKK